MKNYYLILLLFLFKVTTGLCTQHTVSSTNSSIVFSPDSVSAVVGDTIVFALGSIHNATEVSLGTWNIPGNTSNGGFQVGFGGGMIQVTIAKTYYYVCDNHYQMGMKGRIVVTSASGIHDPSGSSVGIEIYPNPVSAGVTIKNNLPEGKENQLRLFDISGKCVYQKNNITPFQYLDISDFSAGVYFVAIRTDDLFLEKKLVVSK